MSCSFDPLGLGPKGDAAAWKEMQTKELNNGRLAMIAIAAFTAWSASRRSSSTWPCALRRRPSWSWMTLSATLASRM